MTDKELFVQMVERDVMNLYESFAKTNVFLQLSPVQEKVYDYADVGIGYLADLLFGGDTTKSSVEDAAEMAQLVAQDKINEYRARLKKEKAKSSSES